MNASQVFNQFASSKSFTQSGNFVRSTQPGKPFASTEALNYIPVGYNTSGGNMFRYGALAKAPLQFLEKSMQGAQKRSLTAVEKGIASDLISSGVSFEDTFRELTSMGVQNRFVKSPKAKAGRKLRENISTNRKSRQKGVVTPDTTNRRQSGAWNAQQKEYADDARKYDQWKRSKYTMEDFKSDQKAAFEAHQAKTNAGRPVYANMNLDMTSLNNANTLKDFRKLFKDTKGLKPEDMKPTSNKSVHQQIPYKNNTSQQPNKKGRHGLLDDVASSWKGLSQDQQWALGGAGAVAGLTAAGITYSQIKGSKQSPLGAGMVMAGTGAVVATGLKFGARHLTKHAMGPHSKSIHSLANMGGKDIGSAAAMAGVAGLGLGIGRNITGM